MSRIKQIEQLGLRHAELLNSIVGIRGMIRGSFSTVYRKCGKPNCWCARGDGHPLDRIVFFQGSSSKSRAVAKGEVQWVKSMTENRRRFRKYRQQLRAVQRAIQAEIDELEAEVISSSTEKKAWLK